MSATSQEVADPSTLVPLQAACTLLWRCRHTLNTQSTDCRNPPVVSERGAYSEKSQVMGNANRANVLLIFSGSLVHVASVLPRSAMRLMIGAHIATIDSRHAGG